MTPIPVYPVGIGPWATSWSPAAIHWQNAAWIQEAALQGPGPMQAPLGVDNWYWGLLTKNPQVTFLQQDPPVFLTSSTPV